MAAVDTALWRTPAWAIQIHGMPDERGPSFTYPAMATPPETPEQRERVAASDAAYAEAIAAGLSEKKARIESAKAYARTKRLQAGLSSGDEEEAEYQRAMAERKARGKRLAEAKPSAQRTASSVGRRR